MIRIRTVGQAQFREDCERLWQAISRDFPPDLVIGIRSGGWWVAQELKAAQRGGTAQFLPLTCRRPGTAAKERSRLFRELVQRLPYFVLDGLRRIEYYLVTLPRCRSVCERGATRTSSAEPAELSAVRATAARLRPAARVLVVDDSLDSGATLWNVMAVLREVLPADATIRTAAFTVLGPKPIVGADFFLYHRINCRFPWSYDFHG